MPPSAPRQAAAEAVSSSATAGDVASERAPSLVHVLRDRARRQRDAEGYLFLAQGEEASERLTWGELDRRARTIAARLTGIGAERALLLYPPGLEFVAAFFGCLYAGTAAVPTYPPGGRRNLPRLAALAADSRPGAILTTAKLAAGDLGAASEVPELAGLPTVATDELDAALAEGWRSPRVGPEDIAFLQYTSGSTALPKGVRVTHANLMHNQEAIRRGFGQSAGSVIVGWLPLYHDMGLIGNVLQPLYVGARCILMSPIAFLQRPRRWLEAIDRFRATTSGGPDFAFDLCVERVPEAERAGLDLSSWRLAFNGAEPVRAATLERFSAAFASCGFRREAFHPCYGLAEATLFVSGGEPGAAPVVREFAVADLERHRPRAGRAPGERRAAREGGPVPARRLVGCGRPWGGQEVAIVDPDAGRRLAPGEVGEIWIAGPSVAAGYFGRGGDEPTFSGRLTGNERPYLRTGDLGFFDDGELFVTGRLKDLIILRGRNLYPQDLEQSVATGHPALVAAGGAAFAVDLGDEERLVVVHEIARRREAEAGEAVEAALAAVAEEHAARAWEVVVIRQGTLPRTSSGKVRRRACREAWLAGELTVLARRGPARDRGAERSGDTAAGDAERPGQPTREELSVLDHEARRRRLEPWLVGLAALALRVEPGRLDPARALTAAGLDSLAAVEFQVRVERALGMGPPLEDLLGGATPAELAGKLAAALEAPVPAACGPRLVPGPEVGDHPASPGQRALHFLDRRTPGSHAYHLAGAAGLVGRLDREALGRALGDLVARHAALRTIFAEGPDGLVQRVAPEGGVELETLTAAGWSERRLQDWIAAAARRPFALERGPLLRAALLERGDQAPVLVLALHHLIADYWSLGVLLRDWAALYARRAGEAGAGPLPELPVTYADWTRWHAARIAGAYGEGLEEFWRRELAGPPPRLELPVDRPRPGRREGRAGVCRFVLPQELVGRLEAGARNAGTTLFTLLAGAFGVLLARSAGCDELVLGTPTAGRGLPELDDLVGYFVNPLPLRLRTAGDPSFAAYLAAVRDTVNAVFEHRELPLPRIARLARPAAAEAAAPEGSPLFDVLFALETARGASAAAALGPFALGAAGGRLPFGGLTLESVEVAPPGAPFALDLVLAPAAGGWAGALTFAAELFDATTVRRLAEQYASLLEAVAQAPERRLSRLPLLGAAPRHQLLHEWGEGPAPEPPAGGVAAGRLHTAVLARAAERPDAVAVEAEGAALSYGELAARARRLAAALRRRGVGPEVPVGVCLEPSVGRVVALLGALASGGVYLPLDPGHPELRRRRLLARAGAGALVTRRRFWRRPPAALALLTPEPETLRAERSRAPADDRRPAPLAGSAAYLIYTSGSTGEPKGVAVAHGPAASHLATLTRYLGVAPGDRALALASPAFDVALDQLLPVLAAGGTAILGPRELPAPGELKRRMALAAVTVCDLPAAYWQAWVEDPTPPPGSLRLLSVGGEAMPAAPLGRRGTGLGRAGRLVNAYGPTEAVVTATCAEVSAPPPGAGAAAASVPIGRPLAGRGARVLDAAGEAVPLGVPGELHLGGVLARGYLGRPAATAEHFVPDALCRRAGARLYRTGDRARWLKGGELEFLGRLDDQLEVHGFRIEPGEVEAALGGHPGVLEVAVTAAGEGETRRLIGWAVPRPGEALEPEALKEYLAERLPPYLVPARVELLDALPRSAAGKIDRRSLAARPVAAGAKPAGRAPATPLEEVVAATFAAVLELAEVGAEEDFFGLGGHSLAAVRAVARLREATGVELALPRLFAAPTVAAVAREIAAARRRGEAAAGEPQLAPVPRREVAEPSFAQERFWLLERLAPGSGRYHVAGGIGLGGELAEAALAAAVAEVVRRHEALRTVFRERAGRPVQRVLPAPAPAPLPVADLTGLPDARRAGEEARLVAAHGRSGFDLAGEAGLLRAALLRCGRERRRSVLLVAMHHAVADGWSLGVFLRELTDLYAAFAAGRPSPLPELALQYADWAAWERRWATPERVGAQVDRARRRLAGVPGVLELPTDRPRPAAGLEPPPQSAARLPVAFEPGLADAVRGFARAEEATPFMVLLGGLAAVLGRLAGVSCLAVGTPVAGRDRVEVEGLIGCFVNTLVLPAELSGDPPFRAFLARLRETTLAAYDDRDLPFERLVEALAPRRDLAVNPLFQVLLVLQGAPLTLELSGLETELLQPEERAAKLDLSLELEEVDGGFAGALAYDPALFDRSTAARLARRLEILLAAAVAEPEARVGDLPLLAAAERHQVLEEWGRGGVASAPGATVPDQIADNVRRAPAAPAVVWPGGGLSYAELDRLAAALARRLARHGVGPERTVALVLPASPELLVSILAVWKAGGAFLPLDPADPPARRVTLVREAGARAIVAGPALSELPEVPRLEPEAIASGAAAPPADPESIVVGAGPATPPTPPRRLAYVLYTSGSTGRPKGVAVEHGSLAGYLAWASSQLLPPGARLPATTRPTFDAAFKQLLLPLVRGEAVWLPSVPAAGAGAGAEGDAASTDPRALAALLAEPPAGGGPVAFNAVPSLWSAVLDALGVGPAPRLDRLLLGGEALPTGLLERTARMLPEAEVWNLYGPTEATANATAARLVAGRVPAIGRPVTGLEARVVDRGLRLTAAGAAGELALGGPGLARGYLGRPALTAESFVPDPLARRSGARLYRTGDRARWLAAGELSFLGRIDAQVKVRGLRVEPGEVEAALAAFRGVREAAVVAAGEGEDKRLVAWVVPAAGEELDVGALRAHLVARLPRHMVPSRIEPVGELPRGATGKVDRGALAARSLPAERPANGRAAATPLEEVVAGVFADVLELPRVGAEEGFFELGGHSLSAVRVVSRLAEAVGVELPLTRLFAAPTVAALAREVEEARGAGRAAEPPPMPRPEGPAEPVAPSFAQERLWLLEKLAPGSGRYHVAGGVELAGSLAVAALEGAAAEIVRRHEALRTVLPEIDGRPVQRVLPPPPPAPLPVVDLTRIAEAEQAAAAGRLLDAHAGNPFDLATGPLHRIRVLRLAPERHDVLLAEHHVVSDGWSLGVLVGEIGRLYGAFAAGRPSPLPELAIQYADWAAWDRRRLAAADAEADVAWWRRRLARLEPLELPADRPRSAVRTHRAGAAAVRLPEAVAGEVRALARATGTTPFMVLLAAFSSLLARWSSRRDLAVGAPVAGRDRRETEGLVGFFVNMLVLRSDLGGDPPFGELLGRVRTATLDAFDHRGVPFERLVEELAPDRAPGDNPLFQVAFALQNAPGAPPGLPGLAATRLATRAGTAKFELSLSLSEEAELQGGGIAGELEHDLDLFDATTAARLAVHFGTLVAGAAAAPGARLAELPLLSAGERQQLVREWAGASGPRPRDESLASLFAAAAAHQPDAVAVEWGEEMLTYGELARRAAALAAALAKSGVGRGDRVALAARRSPGMIVGMLAALWAGGAYVPLDPSYPPERLRWMLADSGAAALLAHRGLAASLAAAVPTLPLDAAPPLADPVPAPTVAGGDDLAYVIYTSGSTGRPKGVAVPQRAVARLVLATDYVTLGPGGRIAQAANASFDATTFEVWVALLAAGTVVGVDREASLDPAAFARLLAERRVATLFLTTALFNQVARAEPAAFAGLDELLFGGEAVDPRWVRRVLETGPPRRLLHVYGPTESTTFASWHRVPEVARDAVTVPIGGPLAHTRAWVLDGESGAGPVPAGVVGGLWLGGDGLAWGYFGRPARTAEAFRPDPVSGVPGARLYATGDRVRWLAAGDLEFLGRFDHQVKVRGFRIEPGEIETALAEHPAVGEVFVMAREDTPGERRLVAYVVPAAGGAAPGGEPLAGIGAWLGERLPGYMVPAAFVALDRLPLTPNGKVDRRTLPPPASPAAEALGSRPPATPMEEIVAGLWGEVLGREAVGAEDGFFALGGHSLLAARVVARLRDALGVEVPLKELFEAPTVASLARRLEALVRHTGGAPPRPPIAATGEAEHPLSFAQERLWFLDRLEPGASAYVIPAELGLAGRLEVAALADAVGEVVRRHHVLRTVFAAPGGRPLQRVLPGGTGGLPVVDLEGLSEAARGAELERLAAQAESHPFDLARGPVLRWRLVRLGREEHRVLATLHHIAGDGWSTGVFVRELGSLYGAYRGGVPSPLFEPRVQYGDFARWQREWLAGGELSTQLGYWRERLAGLEGKSLDLPADRPRPAVRRFRGARLRARLSAELAGSLRALARREGATLFMVLLGAFQVLVSRWTGERDVWVGSPVANRPSVELEGLVGLFLNTLVLRTDLSGRPGFREVVARVRETALGAYAHQDVPFERLVEELAPRRDLSRTPLFQVFFNMLNLPRRELELPGLTLELPARPEQAAKFDLTVYVEEAQEAGPSGEAETGLTWVYDAALFDAARIAELARQYVALLEGVVEEPERWVGELPLRPAAGDLLPDPRRALRAVASEVAGPIPAGFEAWARSAPERVAVVGGGTRLTYETLARLARGVARSLVAAGVGRGDVVAVGASREPGLVVALLGVLSAGAAFLVVDAGYPAEHRARVVRRARPRGWIGVAPEPVGDELAAALAEAPLAVAGRWQELAAAGGDGPLAVAVSGDDLAYVAFTSGTTGEPRGIRGNHAPVSRFLAWQRERFGLGEADRFSVLSGLGHDPLLRDVFGALSAGATLCLPPARERHEPVELARFLAAEAVTVAHLTPGLGRLVASGLGEGSLPALRWVVFGGDVLRPEQVTAWRCLAPRAELVNVYGATETPQAVGWHRVGPEEAGSAAIPLGRGVEPAELLVVAESGVPAAVGEPGEIWVRSPLLAAGYLGDEEGGEAERRGEGSTAGGFLPNPFAEGGAVAGDRVFCTGDLGRYTPAGEVVFAGRIDHQVKVRGFRVEPEAVEAALGSAPGVAEAAVTARTGPDGEARLVAWVVAAEPGAGPAPATLRAHVGRLLPEPMVPALLVPVEALPRLPNGKLDRRALAAREPEREEPVAGAVAPRTAVEEILAGIWAEVLGVERVGVTTSFFELGGHSLLAARVVSRVREALGAEVPLRALFEAPTVAALAARVEAARDARRVRPPLEPAPAGAAPVLSFAQERLWFLDRLDPGGSAYNIPVALALAGGLAVAALEQGFAEVERRHEVLRTRFAAEAGAPVPVADEARPVPAGVVDLSGLPRAARTAQAAHLAGREARLPFDLARGPVLRWRLVRLGREEHRVLATLHHIAGDGWSTGVFVRELGSLYGAYRGGVPSPLFEPRVQYGDFARWQREWLAGGELSTQLGYWRERLAGLEGKSLDLPADRPRPAVRRFRGARLRARLSAELAGSLRALARREGATLFMVLLGAFQVLVSRWTGERDVWVGSPVANRPSVELEGLVGLFLNTLVLRTDLSGRPGFREVVARVRETALGAYAHQDVPFERLVEELAPRRDLSRTPLFQVFFNMLNLPRRELELPGLTLELPGAAGAGGEVRPHGLRRGGAGGGSVGRGGDGADLGLRRGALRRGTDRGARAAVRGAARGGGGGAGALGRGAAAAPGGGGPAAGPAPGAAGGGFGGGGADPGGLRGVGAERPGAGGGGGWGHPPDLRDARTARPWRGALARRGGGGSGRRGGGGGLARAGAGGRAARGAFGRGRLPGGRRGLPGGAPGAGGAAGAAAGVDRGGAGAGGRRAGRGPGGGAARGGGAVAGARGGGGRRAAGGGGLRRRPRLRRLHVGDDGGAAGHPRQPRAGVALPRLAAGALRTRRGRPLLGALGARPRPAAARRLRGAVGGSDAVPAAGAGAARAGGAGALPDGRGGDGGAPDAGARAPGRLGAGGGIAAGAPVGRLRRGRAAAGAGDGVAMPGAAGGAGQRLRRDRDAAGGGLAPGRARGGGVGGDPAGLRRRAGRAPGRRRVGGAGGGGRAGGDLGALAAPGGGVPGRRGGGRGGAPRGGIDGGRFPPQPVRRGRRGGRGPGLPHRRPRPLHAGGRGGLRRADRPSGEGAGLSGRAGGGGGGARLGSGGGRGGRDGADRAGRRGAAGGLGGGGGAGSRARAGNAAGARRTAPARADGAGALGAGRGAAAAAQRQARPARPRGAGAGAGGAGGRGGGAPHGGRGDPRRDLGRGPGGRTRRGDDELLRARRPLAPGRAGGLAGARGPRRRGAAAGPLRGPDGRGARGSRRGGAGREARPAAARAGPGRSGPGPLLRPGTALVPRHDEPRRVRLQRAAPRADRGPPRRAGARRRPGRGDAAAPSAAHRLRDRRGGEGERPRRPSGAAEGAADRPGPARRERPAARGPTPRRGERPSALRPRPAAPAARGPRPHSPGRRWRPGGAPPPRPDPPPRRHRRLVAGDPLRRARGPLRGVLGRPAIAAFRACAPVRRLRPLAARRAHGRATGAPRRFLAAASGRRRREPRAADRPAAPAGAVLGRRSAALRLVAGARRGGRRARSEARRDAVHGPPRRLRQPAPPLRRRRPSPRRFAGLRAAAAGARAARGLLRQHPGLPRRPGGRPHLRRARRARPRHRPRCLRARRDPVREAGRRARVGPGPPSHAALPGGAGGSERRLRGRPCRGLRARLRDGGGRPGDREVRPHPDLRGGGRGGNGGWARRRARVPPGPLRRDDGRAHDAAPRGPGRRGRGASGAPGLVPAAPDRAGAPAGGPRVERPGAPRAGGRRPRRRGHSPRPLPGSGEESPGRGRGGL